MNTHAVPPPRPLAQNPADATTSDLFETVDHLVKPPPVTDISATVTSIGVKKICTMVDMGPGHKVSPLGIPTRGLKVPNFDREYF